ncbi:MAG: GYF domain-containing protein, partial [Desulfobulbaceae bacterium]|nr:GYF domain-containing protein [Desulfobulbaceae bacterium]
MARWYVAVAGQSQGPFSDEQIIQGLRSGHYNQESLVWRDGFQDWLPINQVGELDLNAMSAPPTPRSGRRAHEIDFKIFGQEMQFVEIELDPMESAISEAGAMMYMSDGITMETIFGDGSNQSQSSGFLDKMVGAGKRLITGESLFITAFTHQGQGKGNVAF